MLVHLSNQWQELSRRLQLLRNYRGLVTIMHAVLSLFEVYDTKALLGMWDHHVGNHRGPYIRRWEMWEIVIWIQGNLEPFQTSARLVPRTSTLLQHPMSKNLEFYLELSFLDHEPLLLSFSESPTSETAQKPQTPFNLQSLKLPLPCY